MTSWVIYNTKTWKLYRGDTYSGKFFDREQDAKAQFTRLTKTKNERKRIDPAEWKIDTYENYRKAEPLVEVRNMMTGKVVMEHASQVGTSMSVASESYWSM